MDMKRSSLSGLPRVSATIAMTRAASRGSVSYSFSSPAVPGAGFAAAGDGVAELVSAAAFAAAFLFCATMILPISMTTSISKISPTNTTRYPRTAVIPAFATEMLTISVIKAPPYSSVME